jgi:hypothetical protein
MNANSDQWSFVERRLPLFVGVGEGLLGLIFIAIAALALPLKISMPQWLLGVLSDLGVGLVAAGIITGTVEPISRRRLQHDVEEIRQAHFESLLKGFMPERIFYEVQEHIIRQPFMRTNLHGTFEISWADETREYLSKSVIIGYDVENVSRTLETYELRADVERVNEDRFPGSTSIQEVRVQPSGDLKPIVYNGDNLERFIERTDQLVKAIIPIALEPSQKARVVIRWRNIRASRDVDTFLASKPSIGMDLTIAHPNDLSVQAVPLHPSQHVLVAEVSTPTLKRWRIEAGLLPYQGVQLSWRPTHFVSRGEEQE